ncbi:cardiolipin synthase [Paenibacillus sp. KN14-4R]|uniref:cardiolipin synthase n=1 Tax=Paenibacillus sp. KN14-4R TaxID=3445773 RepID=UPI003F9F5032
MLWCVIFLSLFIIQLATILLGQYRHPSKVVAWMVILFVFPPLGAFMYYFLAKDYHHRKKISRISHKIRAMGLGEQNQPVEESVQVLAECLRDYPKYLQYAASMPVVVASKGNQVRVLTNAEETYEALLTEIAKAKQHIHFQFYIIKDDQSGQRFLHALINKAKEGVKVRVLYDGLGSYELSSSYIKQLKENGIEVYSFLPVIVSFFDKRLNYRNHRKTVVIDGKVGFTGGINIGDEYLGSDPRLGFWRDTHLMVKGAGVRYMQSVFLEDWLFASGKKLEAVDYMENEEYDSGSVVQMIASGPDRAGKSIYQSYYGGIFAAEKRIYIETPYFIPDLALTVALKAAAQAGIDVKIIIPEVSDSKLVQYASLSYIEDMLEAGIHVYQYQKGFMHAKVMIIDDMIGMVGTANLDMRSLFSNFELNAVMYDSETIARLEVDFVQDMADSYELSLEVFKQRSKWEKCKENIARTISPLL